jgi:hypothetical protein
MNVRALFARLPVVRRSRLDDDQHLELLRGAYLALLGREPDGSARDSYLSLLRAGAGWERVLHDIVASPEFLERHRPAPGPRAIEEDEALVRGAYRAVLQRDADIDGLAWHVERLQNGGTVEALLRDLLSGAELLGRDLELPEAQQPPPTELASWREQLALARRLAVLEDRVEELMKVRGW